MVSLREKQKAEVREALMKGGNGLFIKLGFNNTTIEDITSASGVAKGTFYNYFKSKEDLALAIAFNDEFYEVEQLECILKNNHLVKDQVKAVMSLTAQVIEKRPELIWIATLEKLKSGTTPWHEKNPLRSALIEIFKRGQAKGEVDQGREPFCLSIDIEGIMFINMARWYHSGLRECLKSILIPSVETYLNGVLSR